MTESEYRWTDIAAPDERASWRGHEYPAPGDWQLSNVEFDGIHWQRNEFGETARLWFDYGESVMDSVQAEFVVDGETVFSVVDAEKDELWMKVYQELESRD